MFCKQNLTQIETPERLASTLHLHYITFLGFQGKTIIKGY